MERKIVFDISVKSVLTVAIALILALALYYIRDILILFLISFILATALEPAVNYLEKKKIPRLLTVVVVYALIALFIYGLIRLMVPPINEQVTALIDNRQAIFDRITGYVAHIPPEFKDSLQKIIDTLPSRLTDFTSGAFLSNILGVFSGLLGTLTVFVVTFYLLLEKNVMAKAIKAFWPASSEKRAIKIYDAIAQKISFWARGQLILSTAVGILTFIGLSVLKFEYALVLAIVAAFLDLIPIIGPTITLVIGVGLAFATSPVYALWVGILFLAIQQFEGNILIPQIMKRAIGVSPLIVIFAILVAGKLMGLVGILIAVPMASIIVVLVEALNKKLPKEA